MRLAVTDDREAINRVYRACGEKLAHDDWTPGYVPDTAYIGVVDADGMLHGFFHAVGRGPRDVELHVCLLPTARGSMHDLGDEALALIFERTPCARITAPFLADIVSAQNYARKHGFVLEGVSRDACMRNGSPVDVVQYGLTRRDWENRVCRLSETLSAT